ncbi:MAG: ABC transporter substrate-binding protein [Tessaracoccus sp.]
MLEGTTDGEIVLGFNHTNEALAKPEVRQAINHALDKQAIVDSAWAGLACSWDHGFPNDPWYEDLSGRWPYDPEARQDSARQGGLRIGPDSAAARCRPWPTHCGRTHHTAQLGEVGINVVVEELDFTRWLDLVYTQHDYDMTIVIEPTTQMPSPAKATTGTTRTGFQPVVARHERWRPRTEVEIMASRAAPWPSRRCAAWLWLLPEHRHHDDGHHGCRSGPAHSGLRLSNIASRH